MTRRKRERARVSHQGSQQRDSLALSSMDPRSHRSTRHKDVFDRRWNGENDHIDMPFLRQLALRCAACSFSQLQL
jgi:hypothetical protein